MERTESTVIQVAPDYENDKIKEMEVFGWNLQNRQEIHEEGDAIGKLIGSDYVIKTKVQQYVKLHFARNLGLPNLSDIKRIEAEYNNLPFPARPSYKGPIIFLIVWLFVGGIPIAISETIGTIIYIIGIILAGLWIYLTVKKRKETKQTQLQSQQRARELLAQVEALF